MNNAKSAKRMWLLAVVLFLTTPAKAEVDRELRLLASKIYVGCLSDEGNRILEKAANTKPYEYEKLAAILCKEHEDRLRYVLNLDMLQAQVENRKFLNKEAQRVISETIEQTITNMRRGMVIVYASAFDKLHPGKRSCSLNPEPLLDSGLKYLCAVRD